jgi:hypothetical protein
MSNISDSPAELDCKRSTEDTGSQAKVYAARMRLQRAVDQADALDAIREIAANLIGTEEIAVFKVDQRRSERWLYWSLNHVLSSGKPLFRLRLSNENLLSTEDPVSALVPILVDGSPSAVIVLFRLFPHKPGIEPVDREICEVLSHCAGRAIELYHSR